MASATKVIAYSALAALGIWGATKLLGKGQGLKTMLKTYDFDVKVSSANTKGAQLNLGIDIIVSNPSSFSIKFLKPYVEIYLYDEKGQNPQKIAKSDIYTETCEILPMRVNPPIRIDMHIGALALVKAGADIVQSLIKDIDWKKASDETVITYGSKIMTAVRDNADKLWPRLAVKISTNVMGADVVEEFKLG